jgi:SAM-dependent methyltransferase
MPDRACLLVSDQAGFGVGAVAAPWGMPIMPLLTSLHKNVIFGRMNPNENSAVLNFNVFRNGDAIAARTVDLPTDVHSFQIVLPDSMRAADGPSINVKFAGTDRLVPIAPDLKGFVNNVSEYGLGTTLDDPLFYRLYVNSRPRIEIPQHFIDHVAGSGDQESYRLLGIATVIDILQFGVINSASDKVFDLGCGCGRMGLLISSLLDPALGGAYFGFDVWREGIAWAQENLTRDYPHASFRTLGKHDSYDAQASYRIDLPDHSQDAVIATSVFTHLRSKPAEAYAAEIARVLRQDGKAYTTFFATKEIYRAANIPATPEEDDYAINFVNAMAEDTYADEDQVIAMFERHRLKVLGIKYGYWRHGHYRGMGGGQDVFILRRL